MKAIIYILKNTSAITSLLTAPTGGTATQAVYIGHAAQSQQPPYITVEEELLDAFVNKDLARSLSKYLYSIYTYGRSYEEVRAIGVQVEAALDKVAVGTYNGQYLRGCRIIGERTMHDLQDNNQYWLLIQDFDTILDK